MEVTYTTSECPLGPLFIAGTGDKLCMVSLGSTEAEGKRRISTRFPSATVSRDDKRMAKLRKAVERRIDGKDLDASVPLELHGTPFQVKVWKDMLTIPAGTTRSYADVARRIGRPKAFRAVAQACGANPVPVVVPCHRVVASGGRLGGYTGGIEKKVALLAKEGVSGLR
jgi:AraC family transcriptional regulator of adaptative response/methylated-DNA-[protein]-cysteine methyltransferase